MEIKIGNTPLIELTKIKEYFGLPNKIYAKIEGENLTGSIKDRAVYQMLIDDYESGRINKDTVIIEATSGNTGISLAALGKYFGNKIIIVMPISASLERRNLILSYGAELVLVEGGMQECNLKAIELQKSLQNSIILGQFEHPSNVKAHILSTGPEIFDTVENIKYLFAGIGSGGTITGLAKYIYMHNIDCALIGIEPSESPLITMGRAAPHGIQGIGANFIPKILDLELIDEVIDVTTDDSIEMAKKIYELEGIYVGYSSGAALLGAISHIKERELTEDVVVIFPDKGDRYQWQN